MKTIIQFVLAAFMAFPLIAPAQSGIQQERLAFINRMINQNVFTKHAVPAGVPVLWVGPRFSQMTFDQKSKMVNVVYAYYNTNNSSYDVIAVRDGGTNKDIGAYGAAYGGLNLK